MRYKKLALTALISVTAAVVCLGGPAMISSSRSSRARPASIVPTERLQVARERMARGEPPAPEDLDTLPPDQIARIGVATGDGMLVECELPPSSLPDTLSQVQIQSLYVQVPTPEGARPLRHYSDSGSVELIGAFQWFGAGIDRIGQCKLTEGSVTLTGTVSHLGQPATAYLHICTIPVAVGSDGLFEVELPLGARCDIQAAGYLIEPTTVAMDADRSISLELGELDPDQRIPGLGDFTSLAYVLWYGPDLTGPGKFERALAAEGLDPQARDWLEQKAAAERVLRDRFIEEGAMPNPLWTLILGDGLP